MRLTLVNWKKMNPLRPWLIFTEKLLGSPAGVGCGECFFSKPWKLMNVWKSFNIKAFLIIKYFWFKNNLYQTKFTRKLNFSNKSHFFCLTCFACRLFEEHKSGQKLLQKYYFFSKPWKLVNCWKFYDLKEF
jgi:hypothetical protein